MTDSTRAFPTGSATAEADRARARRNADDSVLTALLQGDGLFGDLSLERWLDRVAFRGDRA
jgi:hypothetical protein